MVDNSIFYDDINRLKFSTNFEQPNKTQVILEELEKKYSSFEDYLSEIQLLKIKFLNNTSQYKQSLPIAQDLFEKSKLKKNKLLNLQAIIGMIGALEPNNKIDESLKLIEQGKEILELLNDIDSTKKKEITSQFFLKCGIAYHKNYQYSEAHIFLEDSLQIMIKLQDKLGISEAYQINGNVYQLENKYQDAIKNFNLSLESCNEFGPTMVRAWTYAHKAWALYHSGKMEKILECTKQSFEISQFFNNHHIEDYLSLINGRYYTRIGNLIKATEYLTHSYNLRKIRGNVLEITYALLDLVRIYSDMGELDIVSHYLEEILKQPNVLEDPIAAPQIFVEKGKYLAERGSTFEALSELENASEYFNKINSKSQKIRYYHILISISIKLNNLNKANFYLSKAKKISLEFFEDQFIRQSYLLDKAIILKQSHRIKHKMQAISLFEDILKTEFKESSIAIEARINYLELLILELEISNDEKEILEEIKENLDLLYQIAQKQNSYSLSCETLFFQAKLVLVEKNFSLAQELLTKAQFIADNKGYKRLAKKISDVHDNILVQLDEWDDENENLIPIKEIMKSTHFEFEFSKVLRKFDKGKTIMAEKPTFICIWAESGLQVFSYYFNEKENEIKKNLLPNLLYAFDIFGKETFISSGSIDRIKHGEYTITFKKINNFGFAYGFKGKSYYAIKKMDSFIKIIKNSDDIWKELVHVNTTNEVIKKSIFEKIVMIINKLFIS